MCKWLCCYEWLFVMGKKKMHRHWDGLEFKHAGYGSSIYFKKGFSPFHLESPPFLHLAPRMPRLRLHPFASLGAGAEGALLQCCALPGSLSLHAHSTTCITNTEVTTRWPSQKQGDQVKSFLSNWWVGTASSPA